MKALIKYYNLINKSFHQREKIIFLSLDKDTFDLGGPMSLPIDSDDLTENFKNQKNFYMGQEMTRHIPMSHEEKGEITKKKDIEKMMPLEFLQRYF